jgi:putative transposase
VVLVDRAQEIGVFRWRVIGEAADLSLSPRERGVLVRAVAAREHLGPGGRWVRVSRNTVDRWIRAYREGGFDALVPAPRRTRNQTSERVVELAVGLRREQPARTAAQIHRIIVESEGVAPSARTIQRHLLRAGLPWKGQLTSRAVGRFEAEFRNELWTGDALHGPLIDGRRVYLFCFIDDHSRLLAGYRWSFGRMCWAPRPRCGRGSRPGVWSGPYMLTTAHRSYPGSFCGHALCWGSV